jgi:hypothetical protein
VIGPGSFSANELRGTKSKKKAVIPMPNQAGILRMTAIYIH